MKKFLILALLFTIRASAQCAGVTSCTAASNSPTDVQAAINTVNQQNTTLNIPPGTGSVNWGSAVNYTNQFALTVNCGGSVATTSGSGNLSTNPATYTDVLTITDTFGGSTPTLLLSGTSGSAQLNRITGCTFKSNTAKIVVQISGKRISGQGGFRFDHNHCINVNPCVRAFSFGVADHNIFDAQGNEVANGVQAFAGLGGSLYGVATQFGSDQFVFLENNLFLNGFGNDCNGGSKYVARYNTLTATLNASGTFQGHATGNTQSTQFRGCRASEVYGNVFTNTFSGGAFAASNPYSGTLIQWGNSVTGYKQDLFINNDRDQLQTNYTQVAPPNGWGYCGTFQTGVNSAWDGNANLNGSNGAPCLDQPGRGQSDLISSDFPTACDSASSDCTNHVYTGRWPNQALEPDYIWNETISCSGCSSGPQMAAISSPGNNVINNRDYYFQCGSFNSTCSGGFTGTAGVGSGLLSARPATCTAGQGGTFYTGPSGFGSPGVAYWATDTTTLYVCTATNTWTAYYTPFTYPHPLVGAQDATPTATGTMFAGQITSQGSVTLP
jgi:hypothetical protein